MTTFKDNLLEGKVAFVAGGTSGINLGIAKRYAQLGAKVAVCGRNPEKIRSLHSIVVPTPWGWLSNGMDRVLDKGEGRHHGV